MSSRPTPKASNARPNWTKNDRPDHHRPYSKRTPSLDRKHGTSATNAEAQIVDDNTILLRQDGKQLYLKLRTKADAKAVIRPEHQYKPFEIKDKNLRMVGFDIHLGRR